MLCGLGILTLRLFNRHRFSVGSLCQYLCDLSHYGFVSLFARLSILFDPIIHLIGRLHLFHHNHLESQLNKLLDVPIKCLFREPRMHLRPHPFKIQVFVTDICVFEKQFVELPQLE